MALVSSNATPRSLNPGSSGHSIPPRGLDAGGGDLTLGKLIDYALA